MPKQKNKNKCKKKISDSVKKESKERSPIRIEDYYVAGCNVNYD